MTVRKYGQDQKQEVACSSPPGLLVAVQYMNCQSSTGARRLFPVLLSGVSVEEVSLIFPLFSPAPLSVICPSRPDRSQPAVAHHWIRLVVLHRSAVN